jgi:hypothetical protein
MIRIAITAEAFDAVATTLWSRSRSEWRTLYLD